MIPEAAVKQRDRDSDDKQIQHQRLEVARQLWRLQSKRSDISTKVRSSKVQAAFIRSQLQSNIRLLTTPDEPSPPALDRVTSDIAPIAASVKERFAHFQEIESSSFELERTLSVMDEKIENLLRAFLSTFPNEELAEGSTDDDVHGEEEVIKTPNTVRQLFDEKGNLNILNERLQECISSHEEDASLRDLQRDQDIVLEMSDTDFEQLFLNETVTLETQIKLNEEKVRQLEDSCRIRGYDTTIKRRRSLTDETASSVGGREDAKIDADTPSTSPADKMVLDRESASDSLFAPSNLRPGRSPTMDTNAAQVNEWLNGVDLGDDHAGCEDLHPGYGVHWPSTIASRN